MERNNILERLYYDVNNPSAYTGADTFYNSVKNYGFTKNDVNKWLQGEYVYTLHKPARKRWLRNRIIVSQMNEQFQADLVDMREFENKNDNFKYILTVIDVFSKYAWAVPLETKFGTEIKNALVKVFAERKPFKLQTDQGREFNNHLIKTWLKNIGVHYFTTTNSDIKCSVVERFNRTLKNRMFRYFTKMGQQRYIDYLPKLLHAYNNSFHRTIRMKPSNVSTENQNVVFRNTYGVSTLRDLYKSMPNVRPKLNIGVKVRRKYTLKPLDRGYYPYWTDQTFNVDKVTRGDRRPLYLVNGKRFYPEEVQYVRGSTFRVEKILKRRKRQGRLEYFVKWLNYPTSENSWVQAENVFTTQQG